METNAGSSVPAQRFYSNTAPPRPTTPPKIIEPPTSIDTPIRNKLTSNVPYSSTRSGDLVETAFVQADQELRGKCAVISPKDFLATYLPDGPPNMPKVKGAMFKVVGLEEKEKDMYPPLVRWNLASSSRHSNCSS